MDKNKILYEWIPYRLQSIDSMMWAYNIHDELNLPREMEVFVDGKKILQGNVNALLNPMIEVGFIHARSLLEFLGLNAEKGKLVAAKNRRRDDIAIEHFEMNGVALEKVTPTVALDTYNGPQAEAERSLVSIFELTNKGLAHLSNAFPTHYTNIDLNIAHKGIRTLLNNNLYVKLGMQIPEPPRP
ncbi:TPA: hypothetical protein QDC20_005925 [Burkholderia aenigmatica]|uniref:hypothetical protein n=1 Tax=Burkholderia sp. AU45251 TaxID=3059204 RepID=UPI00264D14F7|nr:hypothetical protein [Burkholderia sp. AU45251]HDR9487798.1 hypothetical protein [Burkholderia aenigmatica]MDN7515654.1 hypothetical protein [Burkholderia sp. AU45251]HDR9519914.1 hypothetical protein [Burkholderia aenigmatica]HDR9596944.1 hypothetical protein [Burkholderia aenigmatica]HDR9604696.1 hypothetical protein [Burkholderia aenigmatica]